MRSEFDDRTMDLIEEFGLEANVELPCPIPNEYVTNLINDFGSLLYALTRLEHEYDVDKHNYEIKLLELKYSDEYEQYKSLERKKEEAKLELSDEKQALIDKEYQLKLLKANIDVCEKTLKLAMRVHGRENHE